MRVYTQWNFEWIDNKRANFILFLMHSKENHLKVNLGKINIYFKEEKKEWLKFFLIKITLKISLKLWRGKITWKNIVKSLIKIQSIWSKKRRISSYYKMNQFLPREQYSWYKFPCASSLKGRNYFHFHDELEKKWQVIMHDARDLRRNR